MELEKLLESKRQRLEVVNMMISSDKEYLSHSSHLGMSVIVRGSLRHFQHRKSELEAEIAALEAQINGD